LGIVDEFLQRLPRPLERRHPREQASDRREHACDRRELRGLSIGDGPVEQAGRPSGQHRRARDSVIKQRVARSASGARGLRVADRSAGAAGRRVVDDDGLADDPLQRQRHRPRPRRSALAAGPGETATIMVMLRVGIPALRETPCFLAKSGLRGAGNGGPGGPSTVHGWFIGGPFPQNIVFLSRRFFVAPS